MFINNLSFSTLLHQQPYYPQIRNIFQSHIQAKFIFTQHKRTLWMLINTILWNKQRFLKIIHIFFFNPVLNLISMTVFNPSTKFQEWHIFIIIFTQFFRSKYYLNVTQYFSIPPWFLQLSKSNNSYDIGIFRKITENSLIKKKYAKQEIALHNTE